MNEQSIDRASLAQLRRMKDRGELARAPDARPGESLAKEFWSAARIEELSPAHRG